MDWIVALKGQRVQVPAVGAVVWVTHQLLALLAPTILLYRCFLHQRPLKLSSMLQKLIPNAMIDKANNTPKNVAWGTSSLKNIITNI